MYPVTERFAATITGSHLAVVRARLCLPGQTGPDPVGTPVEILAGDLQMDASAEVKASLDVTLSGDWWDETLPLGAELWVARGVAYGDGTEELVPLGFFRIESVEQDQDPDGPVRVTAKDRTAQLQQNRPVVPWQVPAGTTHRQAFQRVINGEGGGLAAYPGKTIPVQWQHYDPDAYTVPSGTVVEDDAYGFLADLAADRGATLVFDELGQLQVVAADPDPETVEPGYVVAPGEGGVLVRASRKVTREGVYNIVTAYGSDPAYPTGYQTAYLTDVSNPLRHSGAFGPSPRFFSSPLLRSSSGAAEAAATRLARATGLPSTLALYAVPNPAVRPLTVVQATVGRQTAAHVIESVKVPLLIGADSSPVEIITRQINTPAEIVSDPDPVPTPVPLPDPDNPGGGGDPGDVGPDPAGDTDDNAAGGTGDRDPLHPGEALWIGPTRGKNHFNVGIGTDQHRDTSETDIAGGWTSDNFRLSDDKLWVLFIVRADGATTSERTKYPRSELREFDERGQRAAWDGGQGTHEMTTTWVVDKAGTGAKPDVNVQQIHGGDDDILRVMVTGDSLEDLRVVARLRDVDYVLASSYTLGTPVTSTIRVVNGDLTVSGPGLTTASIDNALASSDSDKCYFKAGCYINFNESHGGGSALGQARIKRGSLVVWHTGYAEPTTPSWKGTGGGSSGGPVVGDGSTTPLATQAAKLILDRLNAGEAVLADWTWAGCPPLVNAYNDTLQDMWQAAGSPAAATWLAKYVTDHPAPTPGGGGGGPVDPGPTGPIPWTRTFRDGTAYDPPSGGDGQSAGIAGTASALASIASNAQITYTGPALTSSVTITGRSNFTLKGVELAEGGRLIVKDCTNYWLEDVDLAWEPSSNSSAGDLVQLRGTGRRAGVRRSVFGPATYSEKSGVTSTVQFLAVLDNMDHVYLDRVTFRNKSTPGNAFRIYGDFTAQGGCRYSVTSQAWWTNCKPFRENDQEMARFGTSDMMQTVGHHIVEFSRVDNVGTEPELWSFKMDESTVRGCTFVDNVGSPVFRHGNRSHIHDCYMVGDRSETNPSGGSARTSAGWRGYGRGHRVHHLTVRVNGTSNYEAPILLDGGDTSPDALSNGHAYLEDVDVYACLLVKCGRPFRIGANYGTPPKGKLRDSWVVECTDAGTTGVQVASGGSAAGVAISGIQVFATTAAAGLTQGANGEWKAPATADRGSRTPFLTTAMVGRDTTWSPWTPSTGTGGTPTTPASSDGTQAAVQLGWGSVQGGDSFDQYTGAPEPAKWSVYDGPGHSGNGLRRPSAINVAGGVLTITGDNVAGGTTGGMAYRVNQRYCRVEVRARAYSLNPAGSGNRYHPVLLMWPQSEQWPAGGEIDFFETNVDSGKLGWFVHYPNHQPKTQEGGTQPLDIQNWHNYALEWSATGIRAWVDGVPYFNYTMPAIQPPGPMHLCLQLDNYHGENMEPAKLECAWVRIYTQPGDTSG